MSTISVKEYSFDDFFNLKGLDVLIKEYANSSHNPLVQDVDLDYINIVKDAYKEIIKNSNVTFHAIVDKDTVKGICVLIQSGNGNSNKTIIDINAIYVYPECRRLGCGKKMFEYIDAFAKEHGASGIYFQVPVGSRLEKALERSNHFNKQYVLYYRGIE